MPLTKFAVMGIMVKLGDGESCNDGRRDIRSIEVRGLEVRGLVWKKRFGLETGVRQKRFGLETGAWKMMVGLETGGQR